ncbi:RAD50-interacting protein 1 [Phytophthora boehmeriae]|uniref:RAD50-interacting protein 1 n=1 Tax=Phytophthora boehmeriae TaxID=109152 RepID=A0A8T1WWY3_9STRA|nr:RAD50-interacting protein 1 [Phytophthora boehmeriae]
MTSELSKLSATLLAAVASEGVDISGENVSNTEHLLLSSALKSLRLRTLEELMTLSTALETVSTPVVSKQQDDIAELHAELETLCPELQTTEDHFRQVENLVRPKLDHLQTLQTRAKYLEAALQVEIRSQEAKKRAQQSTPDALEAFRDFAAFVGALPAEYQVIKREGDRRVEELSVDLRRFGEDNLRRALKKIDWPEPLSTQLELAEKEAELRDVAASFGYLLKLQLSQQQSQVNAATADLWAIDCVLEPLLLRFRYHFERQESATNRLAKPEWYLTYVQEQISQHARLLATVLTSELHRRREEVHCWDAQILLLRGLVKAVYRKLKQDLPTLLANPPLLCHTLDEVLLFEQTIDDDVGYGSWASTNRRAYPRCVDVFTSNNEVLFAWTNADVEYAHRVLTTNLDSKPAEYDLDGFQGKQESIWQLENVYGQPKGSSQGIDPDLVPQAALQFTALLDFLSQRFTLMETDEHRYLYVMQVHLPLLHRFGQLCDARGRQLVTRLTKKSNELQISRTWHELFVVANALQHVAHTLATWEQSSVFLELSRKVARSETTRAQVLRMHVAYSRQVLSRAAKAASTAVLTSEEATAVRHALAGPGAMIGPTAALSAAYSVGSKTMKSLFRRAEIEGNVVDAQTASHNMTTPVNNCDEDKDDDEDDPETLLFSHTIFERQISELRSLTTTLLDRAKDTLVHATERDVDAYRSSAFWTALHEDNNETHTRLGVSSELAASYTLMSRVLACARSVLLPECQYELWKPLASALDSILFDAFYNPRSADDMTPLSSIGERQFVVDIESLVTIFAAGSSKTLPRSSLQLNREVCRLLKMPASRLREVCKALDGDNLITASGSQGDGGVEQITTILEACGIFALTPAQVLRICTTRIDVDGRVVTSSSS